MTIAVDDGADELFDALGPLLSAVPTTGPPVAAWKIERRPDGWWFVPGMSKSSRATRPADLVGPLLAKLNRTVCRYTEMVTVHAGGVVAGGDGILLAGISNAGKSTLTAGLVAAGAAYLGDEAIGIDPVGNLLRSYPKPLTLEAGSQPLLPDLAPFVIGAPRPGHQWHIAVDALRPDAIASHAVLRHVVLCRYEPGATTSIQDLSRADAVFQLTGHTFGFRDRARTSLDTLAAALASATCQELVSSDLDEAVAAVADLVPSESMTRADEIR